MSRSKKRKIAPGYRVNILAAICDNVHITLKDGSEYDGNVGKDGLPKGKGKATYLDGSTYEGNWKAGKWHGEGVHTHEHFTEKCNNWSYGLANGEYERYTKAEKDGGLECNGKLLGKTSNGDLCDSVYIENNSCCGSYRFLHIGSFEHNKANGFGIQLNHFGPSAEGKPVTVTNVHPVYHVGVWKDGKLYEGKTTQLQGDGTWLRETIIAGCTTSEKSTVFQAKVASTLKSIQAIKTRYGGYTFQSRTEARWAIFFNFLHMTYLYEPYTLDLGGRKCYTCDFLLPYAKKWVEIKGTYPTNQEVEKAKALCSYTCMDVYIFYGDVGTKAFQKRCCNDVKIVGVLYRTDSSPERVETLGLVQCERCGTIQISKEGTNTCECTVTEASFISMEKALCTARQHNFSCRTSKYFQQKKSC